MDSSKRLKRIYYGIKQRCYNPNNPAYTDYGGLGIEMCDEWRTSYKSFEEWALSHGYQDNLTIDRINVDGNYEPDNCRWAESQTQANNKRHYWLPQGCGEIPYNGTPNPAEQASKREEIKQKLSIFHLTQVWLINQLHQRGMTTDKTEMSSVLAGTRVGAKSEYMIDLSLEILKQYHERFAQSS